jgi:hypothetical protein
MTDFNPCLGVQLDTGAFGVKTITLKNIIMMPLMRHGIIYAGDATDETRG